MKVTFTFSLTPEQQHSWSKFIQKSDHGHPRQHFTMCQIKFAKKKKTVFVTGTVNNQIVVTGLFGIRPLWFGEQGSLEATCLSGPVFDDPVYLKPFLEETIEYFRRLNVGRVSVSPYWIYPEAENVKEIFRQMRFKPKCEYIPTGLVDLNRSEADIVASLSKNARKKLKRLETYPIKIYPATQLEQAEPLYNSLSRLRSERGVLPMSWNEFKETIVWSKQYPQLGCCLRADYENIFISGKFLLYGVKYAHGLAYAINSDVPKNLPKISLGFLLWWQGLLWVQKQGSRYYDVDVYEENVEPLHPLYAVYQFKKQFKPIQVYRLEPYYYDYKSITQILLRGSVVIDKLGCRLKRLTHKMIKKSSQSNEPDSEKE